MRRLPQSSAWILIAFVAIFSSCSRSQSAALPNSAPPSGETTLRSLDLSYEKPALVGTTVRASAAGLPPGKTVDLAWGTVTGGWVIEDYYHIGGKKFSESRTSLARVPVDPSGRIDARFTIP